MRTPTNIINPVTFLWSIVYVLALLSIYTCIAGILARRRATIRSTPAKSIRNNREFKP
jgi:hypothetical protein